MYYTAKNGTIYAIITRIPTDLGFWLPFELGNNHTLLENGQTLKVTNEGEGIRLGLPEFLTSDTILVIKINTL